MSDIASLLETNGVDLSKLTEVVITRAAKENRPQWDVLKEELLKIAQCPADQNMDKEHSEMSMNIIPHDCNIEHGQVYKEATGKVVKDLYEGRE